MKDDDLDSATAPQVRRTRRIALSGEVIVRNAGHNKYRVKIFDLSQDGCKVEFVDRPRLDDLIWVRMEGLESIAARSRWVDGSIAGLKFEAPIHPAVFEMIVGKWNRSEIRKAQC